MPRLALPLVVASLTASPLLARAEAPLTTVATAMPAEPPSAAQPSAIYVAAPAPRRGDDGTFYIGTYAEGGGEFALRGGVGFELGVRPSPDGIWYRARLGGGGWIDDSAGDGSGYDDDIDSGEYSEVLVGVEHRRCAARGLLCAFGGVDAGVLAIEGIESTGGDRDVIALTAQPRAGLELGRGVRFRLAAAIPVTSLEDEVSAGFTLGASLVIGN